MAAKTPDEIKAQIDAEIDALTQEYTAWLKEQGLDLGSADEHHHDENLTEEQREWLRDFSERWEYSSPYYGRDGLSSRKIDDEQLESLVNGDAE